MPFFHAPYGGRSTTLGDYYEIDIVPYGLPADRTFAYTALVYPDVASSCIAKSLFDELDDGGKPAALQLRQINPSTLKLHVFDPIDFEILPASDFVRPNYLRLGLEDVQRFFEVSICNDPTDGLTPFLFFAPKPHYKPWCHSQDFPSAGVGALPLG